MHSVDNTIKQGTDIMETSTSIIYTYENIEFSKWVYNNLNGLKISSWERRNFCRSSRKGCV